MHRDAIFPLRLWLDNLRTPFTGAGEAVVTGWRGGLTDWKDGFDAQERLGHLEDLLGGCAEGFACWSDFFSEVYGSLTLLDN